MTEINSRTQSTPVRVLTLPLKWSRRLYDWVLGWGDSRYGGTALFLLSKMPQVAAKLGRWAGQARNMARHLSAQMREEIEPLQKSVDSVQQGLQQDINDTVPTDWSARRPEPGQTAEDKPADTGAPKPESEQS